MSVYDTMKELDEVSKDLAPLKPVLISAAALIVIGGLVNVLALFLYYGHIRNLTFLVVVRILLGICGLAVVARAYRIIKNVQNKYKAPL